MDWATKVDAARYDSVKEALFGTAPALRINSALLLSEPGFPESLVAMLRSSTLHEVADAPGVQAKVLTSSRLLADGLNLVRESVRQDRSEEHTSELQSHSEISYAVFCLKKKKNK